MAAVKQADYEFLSAMVKAVQRVKERIKNCGHPLALPTWYTFLECNLEAIQTTLAFMEDDSDPDGICTTAKEVLDEFEYPLLSADQLLI